MLSGLFSLNSTVNHYRRYRTVGKTLNHKIIDACVTNEVLERAAQALGLGKNRQFYFDSEYEMSVLMDFGLYEVPLRGKTVVQRYQEEKGGSDKVEKELLTAMVTAQTSLFRVERIWKSKCQLGLQELVGKGRQLILTDIGFSQSLIDKIVVFFRVVEVADIVMTSGVSFAFSNDLEQQLVKRWEKWDRAERYAGYFRLSKSKGISVLYT